MMKKWVYPIISLVIFATLLASLTATTTISTGLAMGLMVFALMITVMIQSARSQAVSDQIQAISTVVIGLIMAVVGHVVLSFSGSLASGAASITGFVAVAGFVTFALAKYLANFSIGKMAKRHQANFSKWTNGILAVTTTATFAHILAFDFLRENVLFMGLVTGYLLIALGVYLTSIFTNRKTANA